MLSVTGTVFHQPIQFFRLLVFLFQYQAKLLPGTSTDIFSAQHKVKTCFSEDNFTTSNSNHEFLPIYCFIFRILSKNYILKTFNISFSPRIGGVNNLCLEVLW